MTDKIDFVITWVDGNDPVWQKERSHYAALVDKDVDNSSARFRDWDTLRYWFRLHHGSIRFFSLHGDICLIGWISIIPNYRS